MHRIRATEQTISPPDTKTLRLLKERDSNSKTGLSRSSQRRLVDAGEFPKPVQISAGRIGWFEHEIDNWLASRPRVGGRCG